MVHVVVWSSPRPSTIAASVMQLCGVERARLVADIVRVLQSTAAALASAAAWDAAMALIVGSKMH